MKWWIAKGPKDDVVLSSRVRLARNLTKYPFPGRMDQKQKEELVANVREAVTVSSDPIDCIELEKLSSVEKQVLVEKHLISPEQASKGTGAAVMLSRDESVSIMVNEEDHLRIQCMMPGLQLEEAYKTADRIDDLLEERLDYAFDERLGYLTSCPTNVGTGMRASVMLHLPALCITGAIHDTINAVSKMGIAVRGIYGEGSEALGNIFQVSNQITLGLSELDTLHNLQSITEGLIERELDLRKRLADENIMQLGDRVWRSYGLLQNAQLISTEELMKLISDVRLGVNMGIIGNVSVEKLNQLSVEAQPGGITKRCGQDLTPQQRDFERAKYIREQLR